MNILQALKQLRDDIKLWTTNNLNALNSKIDEKTIPIDNELSSTSTNPVQNQAIAKEIDALVKELNDLSQEISNKTSFSGDYNDLINAPNITEDDSGDMIIADDSGNIIFKADAEGIHTTAVSIDGEAAATKKYVDEAVANIDIPEVDFTGYATETYVNDAIAGIDFPETDLTGYATEKYVTDAIDAIEFPTTDLTDYYTKTETNTAIDAVKEELSESIVAESDEWKVVDEAGNIIFSVDATGAHTTELTLNGESAATKKYVDDAIEGIEFPTTDLTDYATKKYVDDAIDGIEIPEVSFDGYATETYVNDKVADLVNSAPEALDTLGELATALANHEDAYDALLETVGNKATKEELKDLKEELSESIVSETDEWKVVDNNGNIIFSVDADGAHTTSLTLDGQSVEDMINDKVDKVDGKGLSTNDFTNEYKEKLDGLENITFEESDPTVPAWAKEATKPTYTANEVGALPDTTVIPEALSDLSDDATHRTVTDTEKAAWNAKSDFSGDYNDLTNAPNIEEDGSGDLVIADANGNVIFRSNSNGFETVNMSVMNLTINGVSIQDMVRACVEEVLLGGEW